METRRIAVKTENCVGCMMCQYRCSLAHTGTINPSKSRVIIKYPITGGRGIKFAEDCNDCGLCARWCAYGAINLEERGSET